MKYQPIYSFLIASFLPFSMLSIFFRDLPQTPPQQKETPYLNEEALFLEAQGAFDTLQSTPQSSVDTSQQPHLSTNF